MYDEENTCFLMYGISEYFNANSLEIVCLLRVTVIEIYPTT